MPLEIEIMKALQYLKDPEKKVDTMEWTVREKLALSSAVLETGQEYWPTISRLIQPFGSEHRTDKTWCSSKECAKQYSKILDNISTKKRNENNNSSMPLKDLIVKKLTVERIEELQDDIRKEQDKQIALNKMLKQLQLGALDGKVAEIWNHLKENTDFVDYLAELERTKATVLHQTMEPESETTDAMTSSCMDDESNSDDDNKPRIVLHLKKSAKRCSDSTYHESEKEAKSVKLEQYQDSEGSCDTEPAMFDGDIKLEAEMSVPMCSVELSKSAVKIASVNVMKVSEENSSALANMPWVKRSKMIIGNVLDDPNAHLFDTCAISKNDHHYATIVRKILNPIEIRNNLRDNRYATAYEFEHDLLLVLCNAIVYYPIGSPSNKITRNIYDKVAPLLECLYESDSDNVSTTEVVTRRITRKSILYNSTI